MNYGPGIHVLVNRAKTGDDDAFCKVVRVDKTALFGIPYFKIRLRRAQLGKEPQFLKSLARAIEARPLARKVKYKKLMLIFSMLDAEGFLYELPLERLFAICEDLGVYGPEFGIEDVDSLKKRRLDYKSKAGREISF